MLTAEPPTLVLVDGVGAGTGSDADIIPLGAGFDVVSSDPSGRWVVAWFAPNSNGTDEGVFVNPAEVAIIDREAVDDPLTEDVDERVVRFTLRGQRPTGFEFCRPGRY